MFTAISGGPTDPHPTTRRTPLSDFAHRHPVVTFLALSFGWSWMFWLGAIPFRGQTLLVTSIVMIGGFGPALGAVLTLGLRSRQASERSPGRLALASVASLALFGVFALRYAVGNTPETLAADLSLSVPIILAAVVACLVGGGIMSSARSGTESIRTRMASLLPRSTSPGWTVFAIAFYPAMILLSWGLASVLGAEVAYPGLWGRPLMEVLPFYALTFVLVLLAQGGNEEPGWRGFLQPELQRRFSPLVAALIVSVFWSLWHLPLYLNGFYGDPLVGGMIGGGIFRVLLSVFLAWFYNRSGGNLFLTSLLHASFNVMPNFLPTSDLGLLVLWLAVTLGVVLSDKMWRRQPAAARSEMSTLRPVTEGAV